MFLIPPETPKSFRRGIDNLYKKCCDENKKIIPEKLPEKMMAGEAAWLIMSAKYKTVYLDPAQKEECPIVHGLIPFFQYFLASTINELNKGVLIQRRAYGFRNFENYRVRVKVLCG